MISVQMGDLNVASLILCQNIGRRLVLFLWESRIEKMAEEDYLIGFSFEAFMKNLDIAERRRHICRPYCSENKASSKKWHDYAALFSWLRLKLKSHSSAFLDRV